jgi:hypothetical protein
MPVRTFYLQPFCSFELYSFVNGKFMTLYADSILFHDSFTDENKKNWVSKRANYLDLKNLHGLKDL